MPESNDIPRIFADIAAGFESLKIRVALLELEAWGESE